MTTITRGRSVTRALGCLAALLVSASCGDVSTTGRSPVYLVLNTLMGAPGGGHGAGTFTGTLASDVITIVTSGGICSLQNPCPTVFNDSGQAVLSVALKDIGTTASPAQP